MTYSTYPTPQLSGARWGEVPENEAFQSCMMKYKRADSNLGRACAVSAGPVEGCTGAVCPVHGKAVQEHNVRTGRLAYVGMRMRREEGIGKVKHTCFFDLEGHVLETGRVWRNRERALREQLARTTRMEQ